MNATPSRSSQARRASPVETVRRRVTRNLARLDLEPGARIVAAVSGGVDSVALLDALEATVSRIGFSVVVAHFNHGIRGETALDDARFVEELARKHGVPFHGGSGDVPGYARTHKLSLEDAARQLRRRFLEEVRIETGSAVVALGHTLDDQAETVLLNLLRGAGPRGLSGMPPHGPGPFTRPILRVRRRTIEAYAAALSLPWRDDETNADVSLTRNRVRHELVPLLEGRFNPGVVEALARTAGLFSEIDSYLSERASERYADREMVRSDEDGVGFDLVRFRNEPAAIRRVLLRLAVERLSGLAGWSGAHFEALLRLARKGGGHLDLPDGIVATVSGGVLRIRRRAEAGLAVNPPPAARIQTAVDLPLRHGAEVSWGAGTLRLSLLDAGATRALHHPDGVRSAWFDAAALPPSLQLRPPRPGDRMAAFGGGGRKKLGELFIDRKVLRERRAAHPVVVGVTETQEIILWVAGLARSDAAPVGAGTRTMVFMEWFGGGNS